MTAGTTPSPVPPSGGDAGDEYQSAPRPENGNRGASESQTMPSHSLAGSELAPDVRVTLASPDRSKPSRLAGLFSALVSLAMLVAVAVAVRHLPLGHILAMIPQTPAFWATFAAYYLLPPLSEWVIYRRLWGLPLSGIPALLRKLVSNELLLGYLGEVQFYAWARARLNMVAAPFGAIKDVTILSALTGNISTRAMLIFAWPLVSSGAIGMETRTTFLSLGVVLVTSFVILLFRQKLFTLPRRELVIITLLHFGRIFAIVGLAALMWHIVLPDVDLGLWLVLATLRMLVSRLPLLPNKDVVFAGLAVFLLGHEAQISSLMAMMAGLLLATHLVVGTVFATADVLTSRSER